MAFFVTSSCVGPRPPVAITTSASASDWRRARRISAGSSETVTARRTATPTALSCSPIQAALVLTVCPISSSSPTVRRMAVTRGRGEVRTEEGEATTRFLDFPISDRSPGRLAARLRVALPAPQGLDGVEVERADALGDPEQRGEVRQRGHPDASDGEALGGPLEPVGEDREDGDGLCPGFAEGLHRFHGRAAR